MQQSPKLGRRKLDEYDKTANQGPQGIYRSMCLKICLYSISIKIVYNSLRYILNHFLFINLLFDTNISVHYGTGTDNYLLRTIFGAYDTRNLS